MTKIQRTILFLICFFIFLILAPIVVLYSQGYRFDFEEKKIVKTGGFYFKVWPRSAKIYLNGKFIKKMDFLFGSTLIEDLLPKKYEIEIKKEGFFSWRKNLEVKEKLVTEARNIFLVPENPKFNLLTKNIISFRPSFDGKKIALEEIQENNWNIILFDLQKNTKTKLFEKKDFKKNNKEEATLLDLKFSPDSKKILIKIKLGQKEKYFISEIEEPSPSLISLGFLGNKKVKDISFNLKNEERIFLLEANTLFEANFKNKTKSKILEDVIAYDIGTKNIYFLSKEGFLFKADFSGFLEKKLNPEPFNIKKEAKYRLLVKENNIFLSENNTFYLWNKDLEKFEKILTGIKNFEISPDYEKIYLASDHEIWILFLKDISTQPQRKAREKLFLTRFSREIKNIFWYTSHYLIFNTNGKIKITEIDNRDRINVVDLKEFQNPRIYFNNENKRLYVLENKNIFVSEKLLP